MSQPEILESDKPQILESEHPESLESEEPDTDDQRPDRQKGQSDPWHGLDDFED
jgi:hypothetical protein